MQTMHNTLIFYVQVPAAHISSTILTFFKHFVCLFFLSFSVLFQGKFWGFLHNRVETLVTIGEQNTSLDSNCFKIIFTDSDYSRPNSFRLRRLGSGSSV